MGSPGNSPGESRRSVRYVLFYLNWIVLLQELDSVTTGWWALQLGKLDQGEGDWTRGSRGWRWGPGTSEKQCSIKLMSCLQALPLSHSHCLCSRSRPRNSPDWSRTPRDTRSFLLGGLTRGLWGQDVSLAELILAHAVLPASLWGHAFRCILTIFFFLTFTSMC